MCAEKKGRKAPCSPLCLGVARHLRLVQCAEHLLSSVCFPAVAAFPN